MNTTTQTTPRYIRNMNLALEAAGLTHLIGFSPRGVIQSMVHSPGCTRHECTDANLAAWDAAWVAAEVANKSEQQ